MKLTNQQMYLLLSALSSLEQTRKLARLPHAAHEQLKTQARHLRELVKASGHKIHIETLAYDFRLHAEVERFQKLAEEEQFCEHKATSKENCPLCTPEVTP